MRWKSSPKAPTSCFPWPALTTWPRTARVSKVVGFIAGRLNMRVLGRRTSDGKIDFYFKTRGETRVLAKILEQMDEDNYDGVHPVLISECGNQTAARLLEHGILAKWPGSPCASCPAAPVQLLCPGPGYYHYLLIFCILPTTPRTAVLAVRGLSYFDK